MIHASSSQLAWDESSCRFFGRWRFDGDAQAAFRFNFSTVARNFRKLTGFSGDQNDDGEFTAKRGHLAVLDVATVARDELGQLLDQANTIRPDSGQDQMILFWHG